MEVTSEDLLIELSLIDTTPTQYFLVCRFIRRATLKPLRELTFDYQVSDVWNLQEVLIREEKRRVVQDDFPESMASRVLISSSRQPTFSKLYYNRQSNPSVDNEIPIDDYLRLDVGLIWSPDDDWEIGLFGRDLPDLARKICITT